jgi:FkbM family methyltransferase
MTTASYSQIYQDHWVLSRLNGKQNGYFVEFGALDGISISNSYLLEKAFGWNGILCEPLTRHHKKLFELRNCNININCVYPETGKILTFSESVNEDSLSCLEIHKQQDKIYEKSFKVLTISINDLLNLYNAPNEIDYLSLDTEGGEYEILKSVDWEKYNFSTITVEHNWGEKRQLIYELLTEKGYERFDTTISKWDDWYFKR